MKIKVLLLENINSIVIDKFKKQNYQVEIYNEALNEDILKEKISDIHILGIRSKTKLTADILVCAKELLVIGCFCIGTNQIDLDYASNNGITIFNSPFSNSRSVAEMTIANIINLSRQLGDRNIEMHNGTWNKVSVNCYEIRGKTLGIIGYGHIGSQLSVLAESIGLNVLFYDILQIMPLGCAKSVNTLNDLLKLSDFVSLHVPATINTANMITLKELNQMKRGSYLINASRGNIVNINDLVQVLECNHLAGTAIDVYLQEPFSNTNLFLNPLQKCKNSILTPHIGGCTEEAQLNIGNEVSNYIISYINIGKTIGSINFPECDLKITENKHTIRICCIHENVPGVLKKINIVLSEFNIIKQISESKEAIAYLITDIKINKNDDKNEIYKNIKKNFLFKENIKTRIL